MVPGATWLLAQADAGDGIAAWVGAAIALGIAIVLASAARWAIRRLGRRSGSTSAATQIMSRLAFALIVAIGVYAALKAIGLDLGPVLAGAGIVGIALAFALQDIVENYISGIILGLRHPYAPGDQIISGEHEGTVEELNLRYTTLRSYDGVRVLLPNGQLLKSPLTNLTVNGHRRTDFGLGVAYGTDLERARRVAIDAVAAVDGVDEEPPPQAWVESLDASWITIRVRYWHAPRIADMWEIRSAAIIAAVRATEAAGIELPYETRVVELTRPGDAGGG